jgi:hypothetical protein
MKVLLLASLAALSFQAFASNNIKDFVGRYDLIEQSVDGDTFCFEKVMISHRGNIVDVFREVTSYGPMFSAELNGAPRETSGSHGEAGSSRKGEDTITLKNGVLTASYKGSVRVAGIPVSRESDSLEISLSSDKKGINVTRTTREGFSKGKASCRYSIR